MSYTELLARQRLTKPREDGLASPGADGTGGSSALGRPSGLVPTRVERLFTPALTRLVVVLADFIGLGVVPALTRTSGRLPLVAYALFALLLFQSRGLYRSRLHLSVLDEAPSLVPRSVAAALAVGAGVGVLHLRPSVPTFAALAILGVAAQLIARSVAYAFLRRTRAKGFGSRGCLLLGDGVLANDLARTLDSRPGYGLRTRGFLADGSATEALEAGPPRLGGLADLGGVLIQHQVDVIIVAFGGVSNEALVERLRVDDLGDRDVLIVPRLHEVYSLAGRTDHVGAIPVVRLRRSTTGSLSWVVKRGFDMVVSGTALLLLSPILLGAALAVRLEGGRGVLFRQRRIGQGGEAFELLKLRSLKPANELESQTSWNVSQDHRMGKVGRFLRRTSIDELPQLWNILCGDMSIVGPRPERPHFVEVFSEQHASYSHRHRVRSGLTGLAQVNGLRGDTSIGDRVRYDNYYIENWSLWLDFKIIVATAREVIGARGS